MGQDNQGELDGKDRAALIRKGNELYNKGEYELAGKVFLTAKYRDGLRRLGDLYFYDKKSPVRALPYYKASAFNERLGEFYERAAMTIKDLLKEDG